MAITLYHTDRRPGQTQFGLAVFTEIFKAAEAADLVAIDPSVPQIGDAHPDYPKMFVTSRSFNESGPQACACDIVYTGTFGDDLPAQAHQSGDAVQSASSSWGSAGASIGTVSVQFYAPQKTLTYISYLAEGTDEADDPAGDIVIITVTAGNATFAPGTTIANLATNYFTEQVVHSLESTEIVATKYWQNISRKTKVLVPYIITVPAGTALIAIGAPGTGYNVGDTLSISAGGESATLSVTALGVSQSILQINVISNTFTVTQSLLVPSGGSGSGALFNVVIV